MVGKKPTLEATRQNSWVGVVAFFSHSCRLPKRLKFSFSLGHDLESSRERWHLGWGRGMLCALSLSWLRWPGWSAGRVACVKVEGTWSGLCSVKPGTSVRGTALVSGYFLPLGAPLAQGSEVPHPSTDPVLPAAAHDLGDIIC